MKFIVKKIIDIFVIIFVFYYLLLSRLIGFQAVVFKLSLFPYRIGNKVRNGYYKRTLKSVGENVLFSFGTIITNQKTIIGSNVRFGPYNTVGWAKIGNDVLTAQYVHILSGAKQHSYNRTDLPIIAQPGKTCCVELAGDNWIGANVVVMNNVGLGCVIGSGAVVVSELASMSIAGGNPCRIIKKRI